MQVGHVLDTAPVTAIERIAADQIERARDRPTVAQGEHQQDPVRHRLAQDGEEGAGQIGLPPFARAGILVEIPENIPMRFGQLVAAQVDDLQPLDRAPAFLADILALLARQVGQEILEPAIAAIGPVELAILADQPARRLEQRHLFRCDEGRMGGRQAVALDQRLDARNQRRGQRGVAQQQARPRHGRKRRGDLDLGIITPARPLPGVGPAMVEHIFTLAMALGVERRSGGDSPIAIVDDQRQRLPSGCAADAA